MLLITIMLVAVICSASSLASEKSQSRQFFAQLDSVQECSGPLF
jgi:cell division protein FtsL